MRLPSPQGLKTSFGGHAGHLGTRIYFGLEPSRDHLLAITGFSGSEVPPPRLDSLGSFARHISLAATYRPYRR